MTVNNAQSHLKRLKSYEHMRAAMVAAREIVDKLETIVDADLWPVPTYAEMLNIHSK